MKVVKIMFFISLILVAISSVRGDSLTVQDIVDEWKSNYGDFNSCKVEYKETVTTYKTFVNKEKTALLIDPNQHSTKINEISNLHDGFRYRREIRRGEGELKIYSFDGIYEVRFRPAQKRATKRLGPKQDSDYFQEGWTWFDNLLMRTPSSVSDANTREFKNDYGCKHLGYSVRLLPHVEYVSGEPCRILEKICQYSKSHWKVGDVSERLWVAVNKGMLPMKRLSGVLMEPKLTTTLLVESIAQSEGPRKVWYPTKGMVRVANDEAHLVVSDFVPNIEVNDEMFDANLPPGTRVFDHDLNLSYVVED